MNTSHLFHIYSVNLCSFYIWKSCSCWLFILFSILTFFYFILHNLSKIHFHIQNISVNEKIPWFIIISDMLIYFPTIKINFHSVVKLFKAAWNDECWSINQRVEIFKNLLRALNLGVHGFIYFFPFAVGMWHAIRYF